MLDQDLKEELYDIVATATKGYSESNSKFWGRMNDALEKIHAQDEKQTDHLAKIDIHLAKLNSKVASHEETFKEVKPIITKNANYRERTVMAGIILSVAGLACVGGFYLLVNNDIQHLDSKITDLKQHNEITLPN